MQTFFFNVDYPLDTIKDPEGSDGTDLAAAQIEAQAIIRELAADCLAQERVFDWVGISICNAAGDILANVWAAEAITEIIALVRLTPPASPQGSFEMRARAIAKAGAWSKKMRWSGQSCICSLLTYED